MRPLKELRYSLISFVVANEQKSGLVTSFSSCIGWREGCGRGREEGGRGRRRWEGGQRRREGERRRREGGGEREGGSRREVKEVMVHYSQLACLEIPSLVVLLAWEECKLPPAQDELGS